MQLRKKLVSFISALAAAALLFSGTVSTATASEHSETSTASAPASMEQTSQTNPSGEVSLMYLEDDKRLAILYCDNFAANHRYGVLVDREISAATSKARKGGVSVYSEYEYGKCHIIVRYTKVLHGPHYKGL